MRTMVGRREQMTHIIGSMSGGQQMMFVRSDIDDKWELVLRASSTA